jgi:hypothetical protein
LSEFVLRGQGMGGGYVKTEEKEYPAHSISQLSQYMGQQYQYQWTRPVKSG